MRVELPWVRIDSSASRDAGACKGHTGTAVGLGQWQRLALARTFYREARVLMLDELATSADPDTEFGIFRNIEASPRYRTILVTSHDFSAVRRADEIIVMDNGRVTEDGCHARLMTFTFHFWLAACGAQLSITK